MPLIDTHCHLQHEAFQADRGEVLERALETLDALVVVGDDIANSQAATELAAANERVYATVGLHPYEAANVDESALDTLRQLTCRTHVVAIGEIGLDYHYGTAPREVQEAAFRAQLALAAERCLPVCIHCRDAEDDVGRILDECHRGLVGGIMHCFAGDAAFAERCLGWGFYISFAGNVTFPKATAIREAALATPLDRLLIETDSPYLAPQTVRGRRCEPGHVRHTAEALAAIKNVSLEEFAERTTANARRVLRLDAVM